MRPAPRVPGDGRSLTELRDRLAAFLRARNPGAVELGELWAVSGGNARKAWAFDLVIKEGEIPCIMLMQAGAGQLESDLKAEFQVLSALEGTGVPAPRALWIDADGGSLGAPAVIMERVPGETDFLALRAAEPAERNTAIVLAFADAAARLHSASIDRFGFLGHTTRETTAAEQVANWEAQFLKQRMEPHPAIAFAFHWLRTHLPVAERISVVHGDYRLGNFLFEDQRITALLDWEMAHLGDPAEDIAWAYRALWTPEIHVPIDAFIDRYHAAGGPRIRPDNLLFYRLFAEIKHAVISLTAARSFADGRTRNVRMADRMTLALPCIKQFLDWLPT